MKLLLDTNVYVAFRNGHTGVVEAVRRAESLILSTIVAGELLFGFRHGTRFRENLRLLEEFVDRPQVSLACVTLTTADRFGVLSSSLRARGTPIPTNDVWIASHVFETGSELLTFDRHFDRIDTLPRTIVHEV